VDKDYNTLVDMMKTLMNDVGRCYEDLEIAEKSGTNDDQHFRRRAFARAVFSAIEGSCECFRRQAFVAETNKVPKHISLGKLSVLAGETYYVTNDGEIRAQRLRLRFLDHVLLSLKSYAEAQGVKYRTQKGDQWHRIHKSVGVRDRITHPKNLSGLAIAKEEVLDIEFSLKWFLNEIACVFREKGLELPPLL
jgi:hypothetical protein